jgi:glycine/D-amino acid oxidase-like deaminating enzyme
MLVVGAGVVGVVIFHALVEAGHRVTLVERHRAGLGTTAFSGGVVRCLHDDETLTERGVVGWRYYRDLCRAGRTAMTFHRTGVLYFPTAGHVPWIRRQVARLGPTIPIEWLEPRVARARFGQLLADSDEGVVWEPESGYVEPGEVVRELILDGQAKGGRLLEGVEVRGVRRKAGRVVGVSTSAAPLEADVVIFATGPQTPGLLDAMAIDHDLHNRMVQVELLVPDGDTGDHPSYSDATYGLNGRPDPASGGVYLGVRTDAAGASAVRPGPIDPGHSEIATAAGSRRFSWVAGSTTLGGVRSPECFASDPHGRVGRLAGSAQLLVATGFNGAGFRMAPWASGEVVRLIETSEFATSGRAMAQ